MSNWHVTPVNDIIDHEEDEDSCVCGPTVKPVECEDGTLNWIYVHHSLDGRELNE